MVYRERGGREPPGKEAMTYALTITTSSKKYAKAVAAMKRYGGTFEPTDKVWLFDAEPHPAASQWGTVEVYEDAEQADLDYDHQAAAGL